MNRIGYLLPALIFCLFTAKLALAQRVVGYLQFQREPILHQVEMDKLTHLCIAFANPDAHGNLQTSNVDISPIVREAQRHGVKVLISLAGGALQEDWQQAWSHYLQPQQRAAFVARIMDYVRIHSLDGVDVDLEWKMVDANYSGFVLALKAALDREQKLLTAAFPAKTRYRHVSDEALLAFDFINIMAYDLTGPWTPDRAGQHAPISLARASLSYWEAQGVPRGKIVLGLPFYGWDFTDRSRIRSVNYGAIVSQNPAHAYLDQVGQLYFNGLATIKAKTRLALEEAGGVMLWELGRDAFNEYSLLRAVHYELKGGPALAADRPPQPKALSEGAAVESPGQAAARRPIVPAEATRGFGEGRLLVAQNDYRLKVEPVPNPFQDSVAIISHETEPLELVLIDSQGKVLREAILQPYAKVTWETSSFPYGYYTLTAMVGERQAARKLVKQIRAGTGPREEQGQQDVLEGWPVH